MPKIVSGGTARSLRIQKFYPDYFQNQELSGSIGPGKPCPPGEDCNDIAPEGGGVDKEGVKQYKWFKNYIQSPKYTERLTDELPDSTPEQIGQEVKSRLNKVMQTKVGFLPESSDISKSRGSTQGVWNHEKYPDKVMLRPEYSALTPEKPSWAYNTIPLHEWSHTADQGGERIPQSTKNFMLSKMKENILEKPKDEYYYTQPTEYLGRMQPFRYLMQEEGIYDAGTEDFTNEHLQKAKESSRIRNNAHFRDLMKNVKSEAEFIELMNKVASLNKKDNKNRIYNT
tara:strand:+ start:129 stop:980 length:852 start_codon:yes stop_codon:yes gene_type:complete